jgi:hypothetical protein
MRSSTRRVAGMFAVVTAVAAGACGGGDDSPPPLRQMSNTYSYVVSSDDSPPHARQDVHYTIQILDRSTRQPIDNGVGQLYSSQPTDQGVAKTWDGMTYGPEVGTYHAKLNFVITGTWAVAIRFQRDSLHPLEKTEWTQEVMDEKPDPPKSASPPSKP